MLWANHSLLFWLTLFPLMIRWIDEARRRRRWPVASFGLVLVAGGRCYVLLERALIRPKARNSTCRARSAAA